MVVTSFSYAIEDCRYAFGLPFVFLTALLPRLALTQGPDLWRNFPQHPIGRQRVHHVAQNRVVNAVAYEADNVVSKQLTQEPGGPALRKVSEAKIAAGNH